MPLSSLPVTARLALLRIAAPVCFALFLGACGHVPLTSMVKLRAFDLKTTDPEQLMVAVRHPDWIRIPQGGAVMVIEERRAPEGPVVQRDEIVFEQIEGADEPAGLAPERRSGTTLSVFAVTPEDADRVRSVQRRLGARRSQGSSRASGSLSVSVKGCRVGPVPEGPVPVSTFLAAAEFDGFVPLLRDFDLKAAMREAGAPVEDTIASCDATALDGG
jgi:hypothetical protein